MSVLEGVLPTGLADLGARAVVLYLGWASFKAIDEEAGEGKKQALLTFWLLYAALHFLEYFADVILFWLPWYNELKLGALIYLAFFDGATLVYEKFVGQHLREHKDQIDKLLTKDGIQAAGQKLMTSLKRGGGQKLE